MKEKISIEVDVKNAAELVQVSAALRVVAEKVAPQELIRLSQAITKNPGLVKTALKWI